MPTDPINGLSGIMQALRRRFAERASESGGGRPAATPKTQPRAAVQAGIDELERKIALRLRSLQPDERTSPRATRVFIETTLAWEFGDEILTDPSCAELAADIQKAIDDSPDIRKRFDAMLKNLSR